MPPSSVDDVTSEANENSKRPLQTWWTLCHLGIMTHSFYCFSKMGDNLFSEKKKHERILRTIEALIQTVYLMTTADSLTPKSKPNVSL